MDVLKHKLAILILSLVVCVSCDFKYGVHKLEPLGSHADHNENVLEAIDRELKAKPNDGDLLKRRVNYLEISDWPKGSEKAILEALVVLPEDGELHYQKGHYYFSLDRLEQARNSLVQAGDLGYLTADYFLVFTKVLLRSGDSDEALKQINRFQHLDPNNYRSHHMKGKIFYGQRDTLQALASFEQAFKMYKNDDELNLQLLDLYLTQKDTINFNSVLKRMTRDDSGWLMKVALLKQDHNLPYHAIQDFKKVVSMNPQNLLARGYLTDAYFRLNNYDSAIRHSRIITSLDSTNLQSRLIRARSYGLKYNYSAAIGEYQRLLTIDSTYVNASEELNTIYRKVAYLRRLKEEQESIPQFEFTPIKKKKINID